MKYSAHKNKGFTLIEIIVSLGIFAIVATVALGALVKIISANKKAQTILASVTNINYALETMSREMRVGRNYYCNNVSVSKLNDSFDESILDASSTKCPDGISSGTLGANNGTVIAFTSTRVDTTHACNLITAYLFYKDSSNKFPLYKAEQSVCQAPGSDVYLFEPILDQSVAVDSYYVKVSATNEDPYPRATLRISGFAGTVEKDKTYFDIQTVISARVK